MPFLIKMSVKSPRALAIDVPPEPLRLSVGSSLTLSDLWTPSQWTNEKKRKAGFSPRCNDAAMGLQYAHTRNSEASHEPILFPVRIRPADHDYIGQSRQSSNNQGQSRRYRSADALRPARGICTAHRHQAGARPRGAEGAAAAHSRGAGYSETGG